MFHRNILHSLKQVHVEKVFFFKIDERRRLGSKRLQLRRMKPDYGGSDPIPRIFEVYDHAKFQFANTGRILHSGPFLVVSTAVDPAVENEGETPGEASFGRATDAAKTKPLRKKTLTSQL